MPLASNLAPDKRFVGMFVGPKHSGKTVAACSFVSLDPLSNNKKLIKVFDFDGRIRGLLGAPWIDRSIVDYTYFEPRTGTGQKTAFERVNTECELLLANASRYGTVIADSLTAETFAFLQDAIPLTHLKTNESGQKREVGKKLGTMHMPGPEDYGFEANGTYQFLAFLRSLPIQNIIVTAHLVDRFGKPPKPDGSGPDPYAESVVIGEKLSIRDKIAANSLIYFDHIFRFERRMNYGQKERFFVRFKSDFACTSYPGLPDTEIEITGKDFYNQTLLPYVMAAPPTAQGNGKEIL
jgi:hypothetical protein